MILINYVTYLYAIANKYSSKDKTAVPLKSCHYYHRTAPPPRKMDTSPQRALSFVLNEAIVERFYCDLLLLTDSDSSLPGKWYLIKNVIILSFKCLYDQQGFYSYGSSIMFQKGILRKKTGFWDFNA